MTTTAYKTASGYTYVITTGQPESPVLVGEGSSLRAAMKDRTPTGAQSAGRWPRERDLDVIAAACVENAEQLEADLGDGEPVADLPTIEALRVVGTDVTWTSEHGWQAAVTVRTNHGAISVSVGVHDREMPTMLNVEHHNATGLVSVWTDAPDVDAWLDKGLQHLDPDDLLAFAREPAIEAWDARVKRVPAAELAASRRSDRP